MIKHKVDLLYKYMTVDRALRILLTNTIFAPKPERFNDPFDCALYYKRQIPLAKYRERAIRKHIAKGVSESEAIKFAARDIDSNGELNLEVLERIKKTENEFDEENKNCGIICLSANPKSILMWSHYADSHKGICIGFERCSTNYLGDDECTHEVSYADVYPLVEFAEIGLPGSPVSKKLFFTKASNWYYEEEWRLRYKTGDELKKVPGKISEVILGLKTPEYEETAIRASCGNGIAVRKMKKIDGKFELDFN